jgi:predicted DNA-binding transcriptional regulator YafY
MDYARMLVAWCELRGDFRHFRADRVTAAAFLDERYPERPGILRARWRKGLEDKPFSPPAAPSAA